MEDDGSGKGGTVGGKRKGMAMIAAGLLVPASLPSSGAPSQPAAWCRIRNVAFEIDGREAPLVDVRRGDDVVVRFDVPDRCVVSLSFTSFIAPEPTFDGDRLGAQARYSQDRGSFGPGRHALAVAVYRFPGASQVPPCAVPRTAVTPDPQGPSRAVRAAVAAEMARSPEYRAEVVETMRRRGRPHRGTAPAADDPCLPNALVEHNCGGIVAAELSFSPHRGCPTFQVDLAYSPTLPPEPDGRAGPSLIAGVLCHSRTTLCWFTDRIGGRAVVDR